MKNLIVFITAILLIMIIKPVHAQNFISEDKVWSFIIYTPENDPWSNINNPWAKTIYYKFMGDTIFKDKAYSKMYTSSDPNKINWDFDDRHLWRESNDSLFCYYTDWLDREFLLCDFNIKVGDSIATTIDPDGNMYMIADSVVTKPWGNTHKKHIYFHVPLYDNQITTWIEGVGHFGFLNYNTMAGWTGTIVKLLCFEENGELVYQNLNYNSCYINTGLDLLDEKPQLIGVLSVENKTLYINSNENYGEIIFFSLEGKQLLKQKISEPETQICLHHSGVILYQFTTNKGEVQSGKVMVK